jgi:homoserine kinase type II
MSVYTPVSHAELAAFLRLYNLGELVSHQGISAGIENTNYFVSTQPLTSHQANNNQPEQTEWVLTLFEKQQYADLLFFMALVQHLFAAKIPTAQPIPQTSGEVLGKLNGKHAALVTRLNGKTLDKQQPNQQQCAAIGKALAQVHCAVEAFPQQRKADCGTQWRQATGEKMLAHIDQADRPILADELAFQTTFQRSDAYQQLPRGIIHADLFRDNAMFDGDQLTGIIDWYYSSIGHYLFDLATVANDWCYTADNQHIDADKLYALLSAYHTVKPLTANDQACWQGMARASALRFWLSRLMDFHFPREGELTQIKDPNEFKQKLLISMESSPLFNKVWSRLLH